MTSFIQVDYPTEHPGVVRAERAIATIKAIGRSVRGGSVLLAAIVSALLVVANEVVESWTEGHLLAAWIVMWLVAFGTLALLAAPARRAAANIKSGMAAWRVARRQRAEDRKLWDVALGDARVMADLSRAMGEAARNVRHYD